MAVSVKPGQTELTRIPAFAYSLAALLLNPITACFAAQYGLPLGMPFKPASEDTLTMPPLV